MSKIIHKDLCYILNGIFFEVHNKLGRFCEHDQYADAIEILLKKKGIKYEREIKVPIAFLGEGIRGNRLDFVIKGIIPIDVKAKRCITMKDYAQIQRYLKAKNRILGIVVNFRDKSINSKRILNSKGLY